MTGIYFLINRKKVVYVGATNRYPQRLKQHPTKKFDSHRFIPCSNTDLASYERRLIALFKPKYNVSKGACKVNKQLVDPQEKIILVGFYVKKYIVDNLGGMQATRDKAKAHIEFEGTKPF